MASPRPAVYGRDRELQQVSAFLAGALERPAALVLQGEPGMGKTTLWRNGVDDARDKGFDVLSTTPASGETQLSFAVLSDLVGSRVAEVRDELPAPQLRAIEAALLLDEPEAGGEQPRTIFAATLTLLRALAERRPLLIAIDDIQWLDESSIEALAFCFRRFGDARVSALLARRTDADSSAHAALEAAVDHGFGPDVQRMVVGPLSESAMHDLIRERLGLMFPHSLMTRIHAASGGNPFYGLEIGRALSKRPDPTEPGATLPIPETLQQIVGQRIDDLSPAARELTAMVAVLSDPSLATIEPAVSSSAIDEAVRAGVLELDGASRLRFAHPLFASASLTGLAPTARREIHTRLAQMTDGEERARHLALAASGPSAEVAAALQVAARDAAGRGAIGAATELAEQAIRLSPAGDADALRQRHLDAAGYEVRHGDTKRARDHLEPLLEQLPAGPTRAGVLLQLARLNEEQAARALELCNQAIAEAGPTDVRAAAAHQLAAEMSMLSGDIPSAIEHARLAVSLAEAAGDKAVLIECLGTLCHYQTYTGAIEPGLLEKAVELERQQARPSNNYSPREILGLRLMYADRLDEARALLLESYNTAVELGDELDRGALLIHLTQLECRAGRLADADTYAREAEITHQQAGWSTAGGRFTTAIAGAHLGRVEETRVAAAEGASLAAKGGNQVFRVLNEWAVGLLELSLGDARTAAVHLRDLPEIVDGMGYRNPGVRPVHADAIEARIGAGDLALDSLIDDLEARGRELDNGWARAAAARCRGLLLAARGDTEAAILELERALIEHESSPQPLERGRTLLAYGSTLRRAKRRREAREALMAALEVFDLLGAALWAERAAAEIARIPGRTAGTSDLSATEQRVAELVAEGLSNKEIAARMFVSVRTVEANLSNIYGKLGLRSRTELAGRYVQR